MIVQWVTGQPLGLRVYVHGRVFRRSFVWPLVLSLLVTPWTLPFVEAWPEYARNTLQYGMFLLPLVAAWIMPRLLPNWEDNGWLVAVRLPPWRLALEQSLLALLLFALLWWIFLGLAWATQALLILETGAMAAPPALVGWIGLSGTVSLLFFTGCSLLGRHWRGTEVAGFLTTSVWIGGLWLARQGESLSLFTPFHAYYALSSPAFEATTTELGIQLGILCLLSLALWTAGIGFSSVRVRSGRDGPLRKPWPGSLTGILRGPLILRLVLLELRQVVRRKLFWLYLSVPLGLVLAMALLEGALDLTEFLPNTTTNLLFFTVPLLAVLLAPALTRPHRLGYDWFWATPAVWTQEALAQLLAFGLVALGATLAWGTFALFWGIGQAYWTWSQAVSLIYTWATLWLPMSVVPVFLLCGLALLFRQGLAVTALACITVVGLWLSAAVYTLTTPQDVILLSLTFNPFTGAHPDYGLARSLVLVYLTGGFLFWLVALCLYPYRERRVSLTRAAQAGTGTLMGMGLALCLVAGWTYQRTVESRLVPASPVTQSNAWAVTEASHQLVFAKDQVTVTSTMAFLPAVTPLPTLELYLNTGLRVHRAVWSEQPLTWEQQGEVVTLTLPQAAQTAAASEPILLVLDYGGWPVLLREDYAPTIAAGLVGNSLVNNFNRASVSYVDPRFLQWVRDSDWTVWPVNGGPHVASQANAWAIDLPRQAFSRLIAPQATRQIAGDRIRLQGQGVPPPILLLAGNYQVPAEGGAVPVWLGPYQGTGDRTRIQPMLEVYERLALWTEPAASPPIQVAYFPFGERIHFADSWMMAPAVPHDLRLTNDHARLNMAIRVTEDWLYDHVTWAPAPIVPSGLRIWHSLHCDIAMEGQRQSCSVAMDIYRKNPQVPHGRSLDVEYCLFPSVRQCGGISPLRRAWAIVLAYYVAADPEWLHDDIWALWRSAAHIPGPPDSDRLVGAAFGIHDNCLVARGCRQND